MRCRHVIPDNGFGDSGERFCEDTCPDCGVDCRPRKPRLGLPDHLSTDDGVEHEWISDCGHEVCVQCGKLGGQEMIPEFQEGKLIRRHVTYQPREFVESKVLQLCGLADLCPSALDRVRSRILRCQTWFDVHDVLKSRCMENHFLSVPAWLGLPLSLSHCRWEALDTIYTRRHSLKFLYISAKLLQWLGDTAPAVEVRLGSGTTLIPACPLWRWVPVKVREPTHAKNEAKWQRVCEQKGRPCLPMPFGSVLTPWAVPPRSPYE